MPVARRTSYTRFTKRLLTLPLAAVIVVVGLATLGRADPPMTPTQAKQKVLDLNKQVADLNEAYNKAISDRDAATNRANTLQAQIDAQQGKIDGLRVAVNQWAASAYRGGPSQMSALTSLLSTGSPQDYIDEVAMLNYLSADQRRNVSDLVKSRKELDVQLADAKKQTDAANTAANTAKQQLDQANGLLAQAQKIANQYNVSGNDTDRGTAPVDPGPVSGSVAAVIAYAKNHLGDSYVWGAAGPSSFDCSGLTMMAWKQAGVSLPHNSYDQYKATRRVSLSALQVGDLVFYGSSASNIHHVALYVGGGEVIHAPQPGEVVKYASVHMESDLFAGGRP
ncbi:MAG: NlpC/P60 family protein [Mycobacteriales bacterium]